MNSKRQHKDFEEMMNQLNQVDSHFCIKKSYSLLKRPVYLMAKRLIDILFSSFLLVLLFPLLFFVAILIKLRDGGSIFYISTRVGLHGKHFSFPKFRSMVLKAEAMKQTMKNENDHGSDQVTFKIKNDPRVTWVGQWIRRFSIDELPQLWCVLIGEMTLVGPRPPIPDEVKMYSLKERHRLDVVPGITCIWQVSGRGDIPFPEQMKMDLEYIKKRNMVFDCYILLKTIPAVISGRGAY